jgi:hypothetical protein
MKVAVCWEPVGSQHSVSNYSLAFIQIFSLGLADERLHHYQRRQS